MAPDPRVAQQGLYEFRHVLVVHLEHLLGVEGGGTLEYLVDQLVLLVNKHLELTHLLVLTDILPVDPGLQGPDQVANGRLGHAQGDGGGATRSQFDHRVESFDRTLYLPSHAAQRKNLPNAESSLIVEPRQRSERIDLDFECTRTRRGGSHAHLPTT